MLKRKYGFSDKEMNEHIASLFDRYRNRGMNDSLKRLSRDPVRKLGSGERIVGAMRNCIECGIFPHETIKIIFYAAKYTDPDDPSSCSIAKMLSDSGIGKVLSSVCGILQSEPLYVELCAFYSDFKF